MERVVDQVWHAVMIQIVGLVVAVYIGIIQAVSSQMYTNIVCAIENDLYLN